jgi:AcrR family transcriptional regulator
MPKIAESTVKEHRRHMMSQILDAAETILKVQGRQALTMSTISKKTGIARNSLYRYAPNADSLCNMVLARRLPIWIDALQQALNEATNPQEQIESWCSINMHEASKHGHGWLMELFGASQHERIRNNFLYASNTTNHSTVKQSPTHSSSEQEIEQTMIHFHKLVNQPLIDAWLALTPTRAQAQTGVELTRGLVQSGMRLIDSAQRSGDNAPTETTQDIETKVVECVHAVITTLTSTT